MESGHFGNAGPERVFQDTDQPWKGKADDNGEYWVGVSCTTYHDISEMAMVAIEQKGHRHIAPEAHFLYQSEIIRTGALGNRGNQEVIVWEAGEE